MADIDFDLEGKFGVILRDKLEVLYDLYVFIDGRFVRGEDAKISVFDHCILYGDGIYEGIRVYGGHIFKLDEHVKRLFDSAKGLALEIPLTKEEMIEAIRKTVEINGLRDAHIRPIVTRGAGKPGLDPARAARPSVIIMAYSYTHWGMGKPMRLITTSVMKRPSNTVDSKIKSTSYLPNVLAKLQANIAGMDDALMLDNRGFVAECTGENIWIVKDGELFTPTLVSALGGITRATVFEMAETLGYRAMEKDLTIQDVYCADEAFVCGTACEIKPVGEVDGRTIGNGEVGEVTKRIIERYEVVRKGGPAK